MKIYFFTAAFLLSTLVYSQVKVADTLSENNISEVTILAKKPTVENKVDRTVFNVANSSILAGNTTWDILVMTPLVSVDNNDIVRAEGESVTVYINDRKSIFTGKELKEYLKSIPAENLMKIEVITSPSARYEAAGEVINIVLKKLENEGTKGSLTVNNTQKIKNSQYSNLNFNYHKNNFTQSFSGSYGEDFSVENNYNENLIYSNNSLTKIDSKSNFGRRTPSFSTSSELELNDKNTIGLVVEFSQYNTDSNSEAYADNSINNVFNNSYFQNQNLDGYSQNLGNNFFYKFYDKEKDKTLDLNAGFNYYSTVDTNQYIRQFSDRAEIEGDRIFANNQNRDYYLKADYTQSLGKDKSRIEFGGKINFKNSALPYNFLSLRDNSIWEFNPNRSNNFQYEENLNSLYLNFSSTYFKKLETRVGIRYEYITYKITQDVGEVEKTTSYGKILPNLLLKYSFSENFNLSATYNHSLWRPYYTELNPFLMPTNDGTFYRGNVDLQPNPSDRVGLKFSIYKKYYISANYSFTDQDYWDTYIIEDGRTIAMPVNFNGKQKNYSLNFNTNQNFLNNKLNINFNIGLNYQDNSDFNKRNNLEIDSYLTNLSTSANFSYTNLFNKNINLNGWVGVFSNNNGNSQSNIPSVFHNISVTKIFEKLGVESTVRMMNIFHRLKFDRTTFAPIGSFRNVSQPDYYGVSLSLVKRFGNQKVKESSKTDVEKESGGGK